MVDGWEGKQKMGIKCNLPILRRHRGGTASSWRPTSQTLLGRPSRLTPLRQWAALLQLHPPPGVGDEAPPRRWRRIGERRSGVTLLPTRGTRNFMRALVMSGPLWGIL